MKSSKILYCKDTILGKIQGDTKVSDPMETTTDLQGAFLTAKEKKTGNYQAAIF